MDAFLAQEDEPANNLLDISSYLPPDILEQNIDINHILQGEPECEPYPPTSAALDIQTQLPFPGLPAPEAPVHQPGPAEGPSIPWLQSYISSCGGQLSKDWQMVEKQYLNCKQNKRRYFYLPPEDFVPRDGKKRKCYASRPEVARAMGLVPKRADAMKQGMHRKARLRSAGRNKITQGGALQPALHLSQIVCQDSTRACIEEMLQKDKDLEAARQELHVMRGMLDSSTAKLEASEAAKGQLEIEVQQRSGDLQVVWSQLHALENKLEASNATNGQWENQVKNLQGELAEKVEHLAEIKRKGMKTLDMEELQTQLTDLRQDVDRLEQDMTLMLEELEEVRTENAQLQARLEEQSPAQSAALDEESGLLACVFKVISAVKKSPHLESMLLHALGK